MKNKAYILDDNEFYDEASLSELLKDKSSVSKISASALKEDWFLSNFIITKKDTSVSIEHVNKNCINCRGCRDCTDCTDCTDCYNCYNCEDCKNCKGCEDCTDCYNCKDCESCVYLKDSKGYGNCKNFNRKIKTEEDI